METSPNCSSCYADPARPRHLEQGQDGHDQVMVRPPSGREERLNALSGEFVEDLEHLPLHLLLVRDGGRRSLQVVIVLAVLRGDLVLRDPPSSTTAAQSVEIPEKERWRAVVSFRLRPEEEPVLFLLQTGQVLGRGPVRAVPGEPA